MSLLPHVVGEQTPRIRLDPKGDPTKGWQAVDLASVAGIDLDPWQQDVIVNGCRTQADGNWAAFEVGLLANRQNGKSAGLETRMLAGLYLWGERKIIFSAHQYKTAMETFEHLASMVENTPVLNRQVKSIPTASGNEGIILKDGRQIRFLARSGGSGRGFTGDLIVLDEAYSLPLKMMAALIPAMAARSIDGNPQLWYASSAGQPDSDVLEGLRTRGIEGEAERLAFYEFSVKSWDDMTEVERSRWPDRDAWRKDPVIWAKANPAYNIRISQQFVADEHEALIKAGGWEEFERERLGVWAKIGESTLIAPEQWNALADEDSLAGDLVFYSIDVPPGRDSAVIAAASIRDDGRIHVEIVDHRKGTGWVPNRLLQLQERWKPAAIIVDAGSAAGTLLPEIKAEGVHTKQVSMKDYAMACGRFYDLVKSDGLRHLADPLLDEAIGAAQMKPRGDSQWTWNRRNVLTDISPLVATTLATWGTETHHARSKRSDKRKVLVL